jgi:hypothetical protein
VQLLRGSKSVRPRWLLILLSLTLLVSCATLIHPPASVADPSTVVLITHGISSSLVFADQSGRAVRFAYGDWRYYALNQTGVGDALAAILWPTPAALGRQVIDGAAEQPDDLVAQLGIAYDEAFPIRVERAAVKRLREDLESLFLARVETRVYNPEPKLEFVRHPEAYSLFNNSNRKVAQWLRELGATVSGIPLLSKWRVKSTAEETR